MGTPADIMTVPQAAERIGATPDTIRRWLRGGRLKGMKIGGDKTGYRIPTSEVDRFLGLSETERLRAFVKKVADYSNDGWLAREAAGMIEQSG